MQNGTGGVAGQGEPNGQPQQQQEVQQNPSQQPLQPIQGKIAHTSIMKPLIVLIVVVAAIGVSLFYLQGSLFSKHVTTSTTSTVSNIKMAQISSCGRINSSGHYYLSGSISTGIQEGACINVTSSNVSIICNGNGLYGSGPYVIVPPFTYGILVSNVENVSVHGCIIRNFSYGLYAGGARALSLTSSNLSRNYVSNVWLQNTSGSSIAFDTLDYNPSQFGSLHISGNSTNNTVSGSTVRYNAELGVSVNSTGNLFSNDTVLDSPVSLYCSGASGFRQSNRAAGTTCYNNTGCAFAVCGGTNIQPDLANITLSNTVNSCGSISAPGTYVMQHDIDMNGYVNSSGATQPCIEITSGNVTLDCDGHAIYNATTGIGVSAGNVTVEGCTVRDSKTGISIGEVSNVTLSNVSAYRNSVFGISLSGSTNVRMENVSARANDYGVSLYSTTYALLNRFSVTNNTFGIYLMGSDVNTFENGLAANNTKADVYAAGNTVNESSANLFQKSTCSVGDVKWAKCKLSINPSLAYYPIQSCMALSRPGTYMLASNLVGLTSTCFTVMQNGTTLNCNGHIIYSPAGTGSGISVQGKTNVLIENCNVHGFHNGVLAEGSQVFINGSTISASVVGINLTHSTASVLMNNTVNRTSNYSIYAANVVSSIIQNNRISGGLATNVGIYMNNSQRNFVLNNSMVSAVTGLYLDGLSTNNTVSDNSGSQNVYDYICSPRNGALGAELGGINFGTKKSGCVWMAATLPPSLPQSSPPCTTASKPTSFSLTNDYVYGTGATCFTVTANSTVINCNGHTIRATDGGTFAAFTGSGGKSAVENCNLIGFSDAITAIGSSVQEVNDTFYSNASSQSGAEAISINGGTVYASNNRIVGPYRGIAVRNATAGTISYNNATGVYPYSLIDSSGITIQGNLASGATVAMSLVNSTKNTLLGNQFYGATGLFCGGTSKNPGSNSDQGGNSCSNSSGCSAWLTSSLSACNT